MGRSRGCLKAKPTNHKENAGTRALCQKCRNVLLLLFYFLKIYLFFLNSLPETSIELNRESKNSFPMTVTDGVARNVKDF